MMALFLGAGFFAAGIMLHIWEFVAMGIALVAIAALSAFVQVRGKDDE